VTTIRRYLDDYGAYHRDPRNELTHAVGIPLILLSVLLVAANVPLFAVGAVPIDLGWLLIAAVTVFYVALNVPLGFAMAAALSALHVVAVVVLARSVWTGIALFAIGWALQFLGHYWEGRSPAFTRNAVHLLVGPLWILYKLLKRLGMAPAIGNT
jgi:uncharacterized membrane protein YGL010W